MINRDYLQRLGLLFINAIARSTDYLCEEWVYGDAPRNALDWYRLPGENESRPTVVFFYGGNWRSGRKEDYRFVADTLLAMGCDVVVPDYRLYPAVRFNDILSDATRAVEFVLERLPSDAKVLLMGHSAGAQLGALVTLNASLLRNPARISGFIGLSGPYDFYPFTEDEHWDLFAPEAHYPSSQAVNFVRADAPPLYLLHGEVDRRVRRGHSKSLMEKQIAAGGRASREVYPNVGHVDAIVSFSRLHRRTSPIVGDVARILAELGNRSRG